MEIQTEEQENITDLEPIQLKTIFCYLESPTVEETCRKAEISKSLFYKWIKEDNFYYFISFSFGYLS